MFIYYINKCIALNELSVLKITIYYLIMHKLFIKECLHIESSSMLLSPHTLYIFIVVNVVKYFVMVPHT